MDVDTRGKLNKLHPKKVASKTHILDCEGRMKKLLDQSNIRVKGPGKQQIIHVYHQRQEGGSSASNKEARIKGRLKKTKSLELRRELNDPLSGGLFEAIERSVEETNITRVSKRVTSRGSHVDFLIQVAMKKGIIDVKLVDTLRTSSGNNKEEANSDSLCNRGEAIKVIHTHNLIVSLGNKARLVAIDCTIEIELSFKKPTTTNSRLTWWKKSELPCVILLEGPKFLRHGKTPFKNEASLIICNSIMEGGDGR